MSGCAAPVKVETEGLAEVGDCGCPSDAVVTAVAVGAAAGVVAAGASVEAAAAVDVAVDEGAPKVTPAAAQY